MTTPRQKAALLLKITQDAINARDEATIIRILEHAKTYSEEAASALDLLNAHKAEFPDISSVTYLEMPSYHSYQVGEIMAQEGLLEKFNNRDEFLKTCPQLLVELSDFQYNANTIIPRIFHNIYFTSHIDPKEIKDADINVIKNNILKAKLAFADFQYILWTDDSSLIPQTIDKLHNYGIHVKTLSELHPYTLKAELEVALSHNAFALASDILRVELVKTYGGIYMDLDYVLYNHLLLNRLMNTYELFIGKDHFQKEYFGNAVIAAIPSHPVMQEYSDAITRNMQFFASKDITYCQHQQFDSIPDYIKFPATFFSSVITKTGPAALTVSFYKTYDQSDINHNLAALDPGIIFWHPGFRYDNHTYNDTHGYTIFNQCLLGNDHFAGSWVDYVDLSYKLEVSECW